MAKLKMIRKKDRQEIQVYTVLIIQMPDDSSFS